MSQQRDFPDPSIALSPFRVDQLQNSPFMTEPSARPQPPTHLLISNSRHVIQLSARQEAHQEAFHVPGRGRRCSFQAWSVPLSLKLSSFSRGHRWFVSLAAHRHVVSLPSNPIWLVIRSFRPPSVLDSHRLLMLTFPSKTSCDVWFPLTISINQFIRPPSSFRSRHSSRCLF